MYDKEKIFRLLKDKQAIQNITLLSSTPSTMNNAKEGAKNGAPSRTLYLTEEQTQTRGRFGRAYFSDRDGIYMSFLLTQEGRFTIPAQYTVLAAVAVVKAIEALTDKKPQIKWVNDIYLEEKKLAGILSEGILDPQTNELTHVVIGIGLNHSIEQFPEVLKGRAISLFSSKEENISPKETVIAEIWSQFAQWAEKDFITAYKEYCFVLGKKVSFVQNGQEFSGKAVDLTQKGELIVSLPSTEKVILSSGEISLSNIDI